MAQVPHDVKAENTIICTIIQKPEFIMHSEYLKPRNFYDQQKAAIYWAIGELFKKGIDKIDSANLINQISSHTGIRKLMGNFNAEQVQEMINLSAVMARNTVEEYKIAVNRVIVLSFKNLLYKKLKGFEGLCLDENIDDITKLNSEIYDTLNNMVSEFTTDEEIKVFGNVVDEIWENVRSKRNDDGLFGLPSKFPILNDYFTYQDGELTLVFARRKHGKSVFCMNELIHKLKSGVSCVYFDTEMKDELFLTRMLSNLTGVHESRIKSGDYTSSEEILIKDSIKWFKSVPFVRKYDPSWTKDKIFTYSRILKYKIDFKFFIYDYIKITDNKITSSSEQYNELGNWCNFLKNNIAGALDVPVLSATQMNRNNSIADSDKIERYATTGIRWRPKSFDEINMDGEDCGNYALSVDFNRIGDQHNEDDPSDYTDFIFKKNILTIEQAKKQHEKQEMDMLKED